MNHLIADGIKLAILDFDVLEYDPIVISGTDGIICRRAEISDQVEFHSVWKSAKAGEIVYLYNRNTNFYVQLSGIQEEESA